MPLFLSSEEFESLKIVGDASTVADRADAFIRTLYAELETLKAEHDAAAITTEQTCSLLEQQHLSLSSEYSSLEAKYNQLDSTLQQRASELAQVQADKHQLHLKLIEKDGEIERLLTEVKELQKSKRQLVELVGGKDAEICEKNSTIKSYLDKITDLTERAAQREARLSELEAELVRCKANCDRLAQEKQLIEKHNAWLNDELKAKVDSLLEQRRRSAEIEADLSMKLADIEKQFDECSTSLSREKERVRELETKLDSMHRDLCTAKDEASAAEQRYSVEISTMSKLVDLYKESSEEWSKKAGELEGVIKALETHLSQVESEYKDKLEKETAAKKQAEKESTELKERLSKCEAELETSRKASELDVLPLSSFTTESLMHNAYTDNVAGESHAIVPHVPAGVSGTALAASLLRDGWSLAKMYAKYQEAADALRHEQLGRKQTQAILERVLLEIEEKASVILDERAEHERMAEAYALMNQKLQQSLSEQSNMEKVIRELKAELKRRERECDYSQKEISDLQNQVAILLKECRDIQLRCGAVAHSYMDDDVSAPLIEIGDESDAQKVISEHLLSIKDIKELVEQNAKLRRLVRSLSDEIENKEIQLKEQFEEELVKHKDEAASKVAAVLERAEEQGRMIESLHSSVAMYRRLYEEELKLRSSQPHSTGPPSRDGRKDVMLLLEGSQEAAKKVQEQTSERIHSLEEELANRKSEIISLRSERDKLALEANFAQEKLERFMKEFDHQREEMNRVLARNIEFSQLIVDYQKKLRESSESLQTAEDFARKLNMELSVLKREKELLLNSEKRALDEVQDLSQRLCRLQATLDTIQSAEQVREEARAAERKKQEEYIKQIEREWAEAKKELQEERSSVRTLTVDRENTIKDAMRQVEDMGKELAAALKAVADAQARAAVAEAKCSDLERNLKSSESAGAKKDDGVGSSVSEVIGDIRIANQEIERLKAEVQASKDHMLQYKSIAEVNEAALKQIEGAHENFRVETEHLKKSLEAEIDSLRMRVHELENESSLKVEEAAAAASHKDEELSSALAEIAILKEETSNKVSQITALEVQVTVLKEDLEREHQRARSAQANYERQVILQSETIQELTKTSQALASLQEEASVLRKTVDAYKSENAELKAKWDLEMSDIEKSKNEAEKKYSELNEQNRILHSQLEALHIKLAEKDRDAVGVASAGAGLDSASESGLHSVVSYLRRSKEIAETEISLLKQEKLRLQSQLERALKAAEAAEASLSGERANSRSLLFTEDEFKTLKLQVSEMSLLRESNMQLREENKHNFEECQKLREVAQNAKLEAEKLQNLLSEKGLEAEALRKEIELQRKDKEQLERKISETLERSNNIDVEDYNRLKSETEQMQASIKEKDAVIEEMKKHVSEKEGVISKLEQDLATAKSELMEMGNRLSQVETSLKSDIERQKKFVAQLKRRVDSLTKERDSLSREKESLSRDKESLTKEKETLLKEKESLVREKEELSKEKQAVLKQLEELRQEKKSTPDAPVDPATREKEKEKEARIQILENTVGRLREDNKKERERRQNIEKVIAAKVRSVDQERKKFEDEHGKHKEAVRKISDELEKLKHAKDSLPEGTAVVQILSGSILDDLASAYVQAVESFEREAHSVVISVGNQASAANVSSMEASPAVVSSSELPPADSQNTSLSTAPPSIHPVKAAEGREKLVSLHKTVVETRKTGRKLVRPRLVKPEEPQRDVDMSEVDASKSSAKSAVAQEVAKEVATQSSGLVLTETSVRKRPASPSASELREESHQPGQSGIDLAVPALKKSKGSELLQEEAQVTTSIPEIDEGIPTVEELLDAVSYLPQVSAEEASEFAKDDFGTGQELVKEPAEQQVNESNQGDVQRNNDAMDEEHPNKLSEGDPVVEEGFNSQAEQDVQQPMLDDVDKEEGELPLEGSDFDGGDDLGINTGSENATEIQPEHSAGASIPSPAQIDDEPAVDPNEMNSPDISNVEEQNEEGEIAEDAGEGSDKSTEGNDQVVGDTDQSNEAGSVAAEGNVTASADSTISKEDTPSAAAAQDAARPSPVQASSTTINLSQRARERAAARLGLSPASTSGSAASPAARRGRGGPLTRSRGGRATRGVVRRQTPGDQS